MKKLLTELIGFFKFMIAMIFCIILITIPLIPSIILLYCGIKFANVFLIILGGLYTVIIGLKIID